MSASINTRYKEAGECETNKDSTISAKQEETLETKCNNINKPNKITQTLIIVEGPAKEIGKKR